MLKHHNETPIAPTRTVVLGAGGFIGRVLVKRLTDAGAKVLSLTRQELDLEHPTAADQLTELLTDNDTLVFISAKAPVRDVSMLSANIHMAESVVKGVLRQSITHMVYVSSDAVYSDSQTRLTEQSPAEPSSLHGVMHLTRELALTQSLNTPIGILRPTLIYGIDDPHNGYGPNRFRRLATEGKDLSLFGEGEERRDHVLVDDVAELLQRMIFHRSEGVMNAATGEVTSFLDIAEYIVALFETPVTIKRIPRNGPMPHNGFRAFDPTATTAIFPDFCYTPLQEGLAKIHQQMNNNKR